MTDRNVPKYYQDVFELVKLIPSGKVTTYGAIADALALGSARMVGWALNMSIKMAVDIPAHRVVNRKGELSGKAAFETPTIMAELLTAEGVTVKDDKIVNFTSVLWHPNDLCG